MIYVDKQRTPFKKRVNNNYHTSFTASHMYADTLQELLNFAEYIGLKVKWLQVSRSGIYHFDIAQSVRKRAIGCTMYDVVEIVDFKQYKEVIPDFARKWSVVKRCPYKFIKDFSLNGVPCQYDNVCKLSCAFSE